MSFCAILLATVGHQVLSKTMRSGGAQHIPRPASARLIDHNPWKHLDTSSLDSIDHVTRALAVFRPDPQLQLPEPPARASAVLIGLFPSLRGVEVILTRRSHLLTSHRGEVSFPGGRLDDGETVIDAALRETEEEIGISRDVPIVIGELNGMATLISNSHIVPVVARFESEPIMQPMNDEVDRVFSVPLRELTRTDTYSQEYWTMPGREFQLGFFYLDDETIWGATARMLFQVMMLTVKHED